MKHRILPSGNQYKLEAQASALIRHRHRNALALRVESILYFRNSSFVISLRSGRHNLAARLVRILRKIVLE